MLYCSLASPLYSVILYLVILKSPLKNVILVGTELLDVLKDYIADAYAHENCICKRSQCQSEQHERR